METVQQAVIINEKEQFLILQDSKKLWRLPLDELREDENFEDSLKEAIKSECGIDVDVLYQFFSSIVKVDGKEKFNVAYLCRPKSKLIKLSKDFIAYKWAKTSDMKKLKLASQQVLEMAEKANILINGGGQIEEE
jgi:hypothetical protein